MSSNFESKPKCDSATLSAVNPSNITIIPDNYAEKDYVTSMAFEWK